MATVFVMLNFLSAQCGHASAVHCSNMIVGSSTLHMLCAACVQVARTSFAIGGPASRPGHRRADGVGSSGVETPRMNGMQTVADEAEVRHAFCATSVSCRQQVSHHITILLVRSVVHEFLFLTAHRPACA